MSSEILPGVEIKAENDPAFASLLSAAAVGFVARLQREFGARRNELLKTRAWRQKELDSGKNPDFLSATKNIRDQDWSVAPIPKKLMDRRVEITGPTERKMIINALNSGANVFMADFEDSNSPTWTNLIQGQQNLIDAVRGNISFTNPEGKEYRLKENIATLMVRPRGWHLNERHMVVDGQAVSGSLFDFGLFFFHNAKTLAEKNEGPYFYLPKMESHLEARLWNDVFLFAQDELRLARGTVRATVLIETILAAFEMDEILYELKEHSAGLNCGRWDYIFSFIKKFSSRADCIFPDRAQVGMTSPFLRAYSQLLIQTCHKRGAHAMGGMAAQIPIKGNPVANAEALAKVQADKEREVTDGHDGTWVAHPDLVAVAKKIFDHEMPEPNQIHRKRPELSIQAKDLLAVPKGEITEKGLRNNIDVGVQYLEAWLRGQGCVPLYHLMEDAATAEISRAQVWQWIHHGAQLAGGGPVTAELYKSLALEVLAGLASSLSPERFRAGKFPLAAQIFERMSLSPDFEDFLTVAAYEKLDG